MEKKLLERAVQTAEHLGGGLCRVTDREVIERLQCQQLREDQEFLSYDQLRQGLDNNK